MVLEIYCRKAESEKVERGRDWPWPHWGEGMEREKEG